jgi:hypothetical protein
MVELLLKLNADKNATNDSGQTPHDVAKLNDIKALLK